MRIFLAAHEDYKYTALSIHGALSSRRFEVCMYFTEQQTSPPQELENADYVMLLAPLAVFVQSYLATNGIRKILETAFSAKTPIIPLIYEDSFDTPLYEKHLHDSVKTIRQYEPLRLDFFNWDATMIKLIERLEPLVQKKDSAFLATKPTELSAQMLKNGRDAETYFEQAIRFHLEGDFANARNAFDSAIQLQADFASAYNNRALVRRLLQDLEGALADINEAIRLKPEESAGYINRALIHSGLEQYQAAAEDASKAIEIAPESAVAYHNRASALEALGSKQEAIQDYSTAIELEPSISFSYHSRGRLYEDLGFPEEALADYGRVLELDSKNVDALHRRAKLYMQAKDYTAALADFESAVHLTTSERILAMLYQDRAELYTTLEDYDNATKDIRAGLDLRPWVKDRQNGIQYLEAMIKLAAKRPDRRIGIVQEVTPGADPLYDNVERYLKPKAEEAGLKITTYIHNDYGNMIIFTTDEYWIRIDYDRGQVSCELGHSANPPGSNIDYEFSNVMAFLHDDNFQLDYTGTIEEQVWRIAKGLIKHWDEIFTRELFINRASELRAYLDGEQAKRQLR